MEGPAIIQILLICLLIGYGAGITTAFMVLNSGSRSYSAGAPVVVESHDSGGCALGLLVVLGIGAFLFISLFVAQAR